MAEQAPSAGKGMDNIAHALGMMGNASTGFGNAMSAPQYRQQMPYDPQTMMRQRFMQMQMDKAVREENEAKRVELGYQNMFTPQVEGLGYDATATGARSPVQALGLNPHQTALFQAMPADKGMAQLSALALDPVKAKMIEDVYMQGRGAPGYQAEVTKATTAAAEVVSQPNRVAMANLNADIQKAAQNRAQAHSTSERVAGQGFAADQQQRSQDFTAKQNDLNREIQNAQMRSTADQKNFDKANSLRDEVNTLTKDFRTVQDAYNKIKLAKDDGPGDMALLYSYVKLLDPGSVVRESEFATAAASGSLGERMQGWVKRIESGGRLEAGLRQKFLGEADNIYKGQKQGYDTTHANYEKLARKYNLDPADVIQKYDNPPMQGVGDGGGGRPPIEFNRDGTRKQMRSP